ARSDFSAASARGELAANDGELIVSSTTNNANGTDKAFDGNPVASRPEGALTNQPRATPWIEVVNKSTSPEGAKHSLIPHIPFIKFHAMPFEQRPQFVLERHLAMALLLLLNVFLHRPNIRLADRERGVTGLPTELLIERPVRFHRFRTSLLHFLNELLQRIILRQCEERVNVVLHASNYQR